MRIGDFTQPGTRAANDAASKATEKKVGDPAEVKEKPQPQGGVLVRLGTVAAAVSDAARRAGVPDSNRVQEILHQIRSGKFKIDFERLADKMLDEESSPLLPPGRRKR